MRILSSVLVTLLFLTLNAFSAPEPSSGISFTPYGLAQYRLRIKIFNEFPRSGADSSQMAYMHQIGYYAGLKVKLNDQVSFQAQIGNDWVNTEQVTYLTSNHVGKKNALFPFFHLAFAKWDQGAFSISAGIVPENSYGALDLLERSLALGNYGSSQGAGAGQVGWMTGTNGSITGLKIGVPVLKSGVKLNAELLATIVDDSTNSRKQSWFSDVKMNQSQQLYILDLPLSVGDLTFTPQVATILFRKYNYATQKGDNEVDFGFASSYKFKSVASVRVSAGYATFGNAKSHTSNTTADSVEFKRVGRLAAAGATVKVGPGNISLDVSYSSDQDKKSAVNSLNRFYFSDLKYAWSANKYFEITPRVRVFAQLFPDGAALKTKLETRPEIIFTGKF